MNELLNDLVNDLDIRIKKYIERSCDINIGINAIDELIKKNDNEDLMFPLFYCKSKLQDELLKQMEKSA